MGVWKVFMWSRMFNWGLWAVNLPGAKPASSSTRSPLRGGSDAILRSICELGECEAFRHQKVSCSRTYIMVYCQILSVLDKDSRASELQGPRLEMWGRETGLARTFPPQDSSDSLTSASYLNLTSSFWSTQDQQSG
jgi:hypothetical protein